ncbi:tetratricopeptide repeat protein, partial [Azospirillum brasilense]|uniref:tetratricopeptide repeat protein n=1 Tax=Azospirillum brasilense TaxID=192 RepID=UPI00190D60C5
SRPRTTRKRLSGLGRAAAAALLLLSVSACASAPGGGPVGSKSGPTANATLDDKARVQLRLARAAQEAGNTGSAVRFYRAVLDQAPGHVGALLGLGETLSESGSAADAVVELQKAAAAVPDNVEVQTALGRALVRANRPADALNRFDALLRRNDDDLRARLNRGVALDLAGRHAEAQGEYRHVLKAEPNNATAMANLGLSLALNGSAEGVAILEGLVQGGVDSPRVRQNLALAYGLKGDREAAARVARLDLDDANVRSNLAFYETARQFVAFKP